MNTGLKLPTLGAGGWKWVWGKRKGTRDVSPSAQFFTLLVPGVTLFLPAEGHDHADEDGGCDDNPQRCLDDLRASVGAGDYGADKFVNNHEGYDANSVFTSLYY